MIQEELVIIGAGPAGLSAALEAARNGLHPVVYDENARPGGQLFKQAHKFFGSKEHRASERGFRIGEQLLQEAGELGVRVQLQSTVLGIYEHRILNVLRNNQIERVKAGSLIIATGASENGLSFPGWTLPGVMGVGAAQTLANLHGVTPGRRILMVGAGNVGLVAGLQMMQAGAELVAVVEGGPTVGGYGVHASKLARAGVPFYTRHTVVEAQGSQSVTGAVIAEVDSHWKPIPGTERHLDVDTILLAVGLSPMSQLARMAGCQMVNRGGWVPQVGECNATSVPGIYAAGDVSGIEEASSAMLQGALSGLAAARHLGYVDDDTFTSRREQLGKNLHQLREGLEAAKQATRPQFASKPESNSTPSLPMSLLSNGYLSEEEVRGLPGVPFPIASRTRAMATIECAQEIPCNPCMTACPHDAITIENGISGLPRLDPEKCTGCGKCLSLCPGQAIFLVDDRPESDECHISLPYEFALPEKGEEVVALDRSGAALGPARVHRVRLNKSMDATAVVTIAVPREWAQKARYFRRLAVAAVKVA